MAALAALGLAGCGGDGSDGSSSGTLVFGTAADPVVLDGALLSEGESLRPVGQIFETLVRLKPGTSELEPALAVRWHASRDARRHTFELRKGVRFHDGTPFDAKAVCANFERWYTFPEPLQNPAVSYYWNTIFGGFADPAPGGPKESLYEGCTVEGPHTVTIRLTRPSGSFVSAMTLYGFAMASPTALKRYDADQGSVSEEGTLTEPGTFGTEHPVGTGPFKFGSWQRGDRLTLVRNDDYWGRPPQLEKVVLRPIADNAARKQALLNGDIDGYDLVEPQDVPELSSREDVELVERAPFNVGFVGISQSIAPLDKLEVRQALAHGLDREQVVRTFYAGHGEVADQYLAPTVPGHAEDVPEYPYDPERSKALLREAGLSLPVTIDFWYPTDVSRSYMPDPVRNFQAFSASLAKAGFKVRPRTAPWGADYFDVINNGRAAVYLYGWIGDYPDASNWLGVKFQQQPNPTFGFHDPEMGRVLRQAEVELDPELRAERYAEASRLVTERLPVIPYVYAKSNVAVRAGVEGYVPNVSGLDRFDLVSIDR
jgi:peptide/nickel transport system substrate-binding protein